MLQQRQSDLNFHKLIDLASFEEKNPFPSYKLWWIDTLASNLMFFTLQSFEKLGSSLTFSLPEYNLGRNTIQFRTDSNWAMAVFWTTMMLISLPLYIPGLILWLSVRNHRKNYRMSVSVFNQRFLANYHSPQISAAHDMGLRDQKEPKTYTLITTNLVLHNEFSARLNNLPDSKRRANEAGRRIAKSQHKSILGKAAENVNCQDPSNFLIPPPVEFSPAEKLESECDFDAATGDLHDSDFFDSGIPADNTETLESFQPSDILFVQEAFNAVNVDALRRQLHRAFRYIVYDCPISSWKSNFLHGPSSGLLCASKYEILDIRFDKFSHSNGWGSTDRGLLQLKIKTGVENNGSLRVAIVGNTQLQTRSDIPIDDEIQYSQLSEIVLWSEDFRSSLSCDETLDWHVIAGDFGWNSWKTSQHRFFTSYVDPAASPSGSFVTKKDSCASSLVGCRIRQPLLGDPYIREIPGLLESLRNPLLQHYYLHDSSDSPLPSNQCKLTETDQLGRIVRLTSGGKGRTDKFFIWNELPIVTRGVNPVAQLAGLTDHVPYSFKFCTDAANEDQQ